MVNIIAYRPSWAAEFQHVAGVLRTSLADAAMQIDHIGSTSVPHLCAKDVIDIQITVAMIDSEVIDALCRIGFVQQPDIVSDHLPPGYQGPQEDWAKLFFTQPSGQRRINIHVRQAGCQNQRYALLFRDYLIAHPATAAAYGELKRRLATALTSEDAYTDVKDSAVDLIYFAAEEWASRSR